MINLIPPKAKKNIKKEYLFRVLSVWLLVWSVFIIVGAFISLPVYVLIGSQISVYESAANQASERVFQYESVSAGLIKSSQQAKLALDEAEGVSFSEYITLFKALEGEEIVINKINLSQKAGMVEPISISGVAAGRQSLAVFRDRILALEEVTEVDLPISNLAREKDIPFMITVVINNTI